MTAASLLCRQSGFTPLLIACVYGNYEVAELLLQHGANVEAETKSGYQPLHLAAQYGQELIIHLLLKYNAPPDAYTKVSGRHTNSPYCRRAGIEGGVLRV